MAVMNSSWLISGSQVGVWRLDFNTGLWLQSARRRKRKKKKKPTRKKANSQLFHTIIMIVPVWPPWWDPANLPCLGCSGLYYGGRWVYNSQAFKIKKHFWILDSRLQSGVVSYWFIEHCFGSCERIGFFSPLSFFSSSMMQSGTFGSLALMYGEENDSDCQRCTPNFCFMVPLFYSLVCKITLL